MSRIDASIATQVGETSRPRQSALEGRLQTEQAQRSANDPASPKSVSADELRAVAAQMKQVVEIASGRKLSFRIDDSTDAMVVEVSDAMTNEVIKQIPGEAVLLMRERLEEMVGLMIDRTA